MDEFQITSKNVWCYQWNIKQCHLILETRIDTKDNQSFIRFIAYEQILRQIINKVIMYI